MRGTISQTVAGVLFASLVPLSASAERFAQGGTYVGMLVGQASVSLESSSSDADLTALSGRLGHFFSDNFAFEARFGTGVSDDTISRGFNNVDFDVELERFAGGYAVGYLPLADHFAFYGAMGFSNVRGEFKNSTLSSESYSESESGLSYGAGIEFAVAENVGLNLEYMQYLDESDVEVSMLGGGLKYKF